MKTRTVISIVLVFVLLFMMTACGGESGPAKYDAPSGAPYEGLYLIDKMNSSNSYEYKKGVNNFTVKMQWRTKDENIESAQYTDEYYLEWSADEHAFYSLCEPVKDMSALKNNVHTIKPGEDNEIKLDVDSYFDGLPKGYYRFVKVFDVKFKDGSTKQMLASFEFDLSN